VPSNATKSTPPCSSTHARQKTASFQKAARISPSYRQENPNRTHASSLRDEGTAIRQQPRRSKCCCLRRRVAGSPLVTWKHPKPITFSCSTNRMHTIHVTLPGLGNPAEITVASAARLGSVFLRGRGRGWYGKKQQVLVPTDTGSISARPRLDQQTNKHVMPSTEVSQLRVPH
jgi:hypothetical protein